MFSLICLIQEEKVKYKRVFLEERYFIERDSIIDLLHTAPECARPGLERGGWAGQRAVRAMWDATTVISWSRGAHGRFIQGVA